VPIRVSLLFSRRYIPAGASVLFSETGLKILSLICTSALHSAGHRDLPVANVPGEIERS
jgi:hypothetical protein